MSRLLPHRLTQLQVDLACRPNSGADTCSFLTRTQGGWECVKGTGDEIERVIRQRRRDETIAAMGDNCSGYPEFELTTKGRAR